jgi:hypothetical protein
MVLLFVSQSFSAMRIRAEGAGRLAEALGKLMALQKLNLASTLTCFFCGIEMLVENNVVWEKVLMVLLFVSQMNCRQQNRR